MKKKFRNILEVVHLIFINILLTPLVVYHYFIYLIDYLQLKNRKLKDKLYMRKFGFIDDKHVWDFIHWNSNYVKNRQKERKL